MIEIDDKTFKECMGVVSSTEEGQIVLAWIKNELGWDLPMSIGEQPLNVYNMTRRNIWAQLRQHISADNLKKIEFNYKRKAVINERSGGRTNTTSKRRGATDATDATSG